MGTPIVLVDAENVRRSCWPNLSPEELVARCRAWARAHELGLLVVFDGPAPEQGADVAGTAGESADDRIAATARAIAGEGGAYWLVTSDRELRSRAGAGAERILGGGRFVRALGART
jgi:hypothetical protein